jgi:hypothetical protein
MTLVACQCESQLHDEFGCGVAQQEPHAVETDYGLFKLCDDCASEYHMPLKTERKGSWLENLFVKMFVS